EGRCDSGGSAAAAVEPGRKAEERGGAGTTWPHDFAGRSGPWHCAWPAIHLAAAVAFGSDCERRRGRWFCCGRDRERTVGGGAWFGDGRRASDRDKASERYCDWGERGRWGRSAA